jgi:large subunit ribosomal protein L21
LYAVIRDRSRQATVRPGDEILCDLMPGAQPGDPVTFDEVLLVGEEGSAKIGKPTVAGAQVQGVVVGPAKGPKLVAFRFKRRKNVRVKRGHRQKYTKVRIEGITA